MPGLSVTDDWTWKELMSQSIKLDIWSDIVGPWCYIGEPRLEAGLVDFAASVSDPPAIEIVYDSFQLGPDMPDDFEGSATEYLGRHKGIPEAQARAMQDHVFGLAAEAGLTFDRLRPANTAAGHQVLHLAKDRAVQPAVKERLMAAHFAEGRHVDRPDELVARRAESGLEADEILEVMERGPDAHGIEEDRQMAARIGITACRSSWSAVGMRCRGLSRPTCSRRFCRASSGSVRLNQKH